MKCPLCPYYEQKTSYGTEIFKCKNVDCPHKAENAESGRGISLDDFAEAYEELTQGKKASENEYHD